MIYSFVSLFSQSLVARDGAMDTADEDLVEEFRKNNEEIENMKYQEAESRERTQELESKISILSKSITTLEALKQGSSEAHQEYSVDRVRGRVVYYLYWDLYRH